ncbi:Uncharacterised protein [Mycobacteroides abscessus]|nr:Uncharacterised protein [Mycobacteroides abscessus]
MLRDIAILVTGTAPARAPSASASRSADESSPGSTRCATWTSCAVATSSASRRTKTPDTGDASEGYHAVTIITRT